MVDFLLISTRAAKKGKRMEIYPKFIIKNPSKHLMIRGGDFYAIWLEERGLWSTNEQDAIDLIDRELDIYAQQHQNEYDEGFKVLHLWDAESGMIDVWHKYCQKQMRDSFHMLDEKLIFSNTETSIEDYASKKLKYPLEKGPVEAWDRLLSVLYSPEERKKIEWAIGAVVSGDSKQIQKFLVFYGAAGTGKSTILNIIGQLFDGYTSVFDAKALGSSSNSFALEAFKGNPLVAIQHDGDLSHIEDNTRLNSLVSHEMMTVNEKFKSTYANRFKCFLFMGTNRPVRITDAKSGLIRRLIDVSPTGEKLKPSEYHKLTKQVEFELGAIAAHCLDVYEKNKNAYDDYRPLAMLGASNDFYNFITYPDYWDIFVKRDETTAKAAWEMYNKYCTEAKVQYPYSFRPFKEELKNYFEIFRERETLEDGTRVRSYYKGFKRDKFEEQLTEAVPQDDEKYISELGLRLGHSLFDDQFKDCPAQYASADGAPSFKWDSVQTSLKDLDTRKTHYVLVPKNLIVIDFDIPNANGEKDFLLNAKEAVKWPKTYTELSKSGKGIHLHYWYNGDVEKLSSVYAEHIEVKIFKGRSSLRRMLTFCNELPIATISTGLPLKEVSKTLIIKQVQSEKGLRELICRNLKKEIHASTKSSIDFIFKILEDAYENKALSYDVSDMRNAITYFAANSTNQAEYCLKLVQKMHYRSEDRIESVSQQDGALIFFDCEVFPNLLLVNWKKAGAGEMVHRMINPTPQQVEWLVGQKLIGFNCRRYDNHILYARLLGYSNLQIYELSKRLVSESKRSDCFFGEAYDLSYTDVYDFAAAANKKSLKKFEIELGIHHQELGLPWDKPVPEERWEEVAAYCDNDVLATEAVFNHLNGDWTARQILADVAGLNVNSTTNALTTRIIFDRVKNPQNEFQYRNLALPVKELTEEVEKFLREATPEMMDIPFGEEESKLPYFKGYVYEKGVSTYQGEEVGEGGYVYAEPGMYFNVALLDIASMHPHSIIAECLFGPRFTRRFKQIVDGRVAIKHKAWEDVNDILDGKLTPYIQKVKNGEMTAKELANALKTAINSVYGLTSAAFANAFRDPRNVDNIVAKRGALFMVDLKKAVQQKGYTVAHIKTDSIKIPDADKGIIDFVISFGKRYGYDFEHEATYDRMCLVNDAVYIARYDLEENCMRKYGYVPGDIKDHAGQWTATGKQFQVPYVFKTLFSREPIEFNDLCEVFSVTTSLYLDLNENLPNVEEQEKEFASLLKKTGLSYEDWLDHKPIEDETTERKLRSLEMDISKGHNYRFVGRVGQFTPMKTGYGGGVLLRESGGRYSAPSGTKGYRFMESEMVKALGREDGVNRAYYDRLADEARDTISKFGDFEQFVSDDIFTGTVPPEGDWRDGV